MNIADYIAAWLVVLILAIGVLWGLCSLRDWLQRRRNRRRWLLGLMPRPHDVMTPLERAVEVAELERLYRRPAAVKVRRL